jgi:hypothetical protein
LVSKVEALSSGQSLTDPPACLKVEWYVARLQQAVQSLGAPDERWFCPLNDAHTGQLLGGRGLVALVIGEQRHVMAFGEAAHPLVRNPSFADVLSIAGWSDQKQLVHRLNPIYDLTAPNMLEKEPARKGPSARLRSRAAFERI